MSITVTLNGKVDSVVPVTTTWSDVHATGHVSFTDAHAVDTTAIIDAAGTYTLRLTAHPADNLNAHDDVVITTALNQTPVVNAGPDFATTVSTNVQLNGSATDDRFPDANSPPNHLPHTLNYTWSKVSGTGTVTFIPSNTGGTTSNVANPTVTIDTAGTFVLRLSVSDTKATGTDDVTVTVQSSPGSKYATATPANPSATLSGTDVEYRVNLALLDNTWWTNMTSAIGDDIRVTDASTNGLPFDVIYCNKSDKTGFLVYKRPVNTSGSAVRIYNGGAAIKLLPTDTNGQYNAYRSDCICFYPDGGGGGSTNRTRNTSNILNFVGAPTVGAGPIGTQATTYSYGHWATQVIGSNGYHSPVTYTAAAGVTLTGTDNIWLGGVVATNNGATDGTKNSLYINSYFNTGSQIVAVGEQGDFGAPVGVATTTTSTVATYYHYGGTCANTGASRTAVSSAATGTNTTAVTQSKQFDCLVVGARPRLSPSAAVDFCSVSTPITLVTLYSTELTPAHIKYQGVMLDQATMFPTWTTF